MPQSTACPQCDVELFVPDEADRGAWAQCPRCRAVFELDSVALRPLAEAVLVDGPPTPCDEPTIDHEVADKPRAVTLADLMPPSDLDYRPTELPDDLSEPGLVEESPSLSTTGWSEGVEQLDQLLARVDRDAATGAAPSADVPDRDNRLVDVDTPIAISPKPVRRRKRSPVRTLAGVMLGGVFGIVAGYYLLLVLGGPDADALRLAQYVPIRLLPDSFQSEPAGPTSTPTAPAPPADDRIVAAPNSDRSAEVPASFVAPVEPSKATTVDDRYAADLVANGAASSDALPATSTTPSEPPRFDESAALPLSAAEPHVTDAPSYTTDQLRAALAAARQAQAGLVEGDLDDPAARGTKGVSYARFCELAEVLTYAEADPRSDEAASLQREAEQLFTETLADAHTRAEVARIAPIWIASPNRQRSGVLLAGKVIGRSTLGNVDECQLDTGQGSRTTVLVPSRSADAFDSDHVLGIVGTIVDTPGERVSGYTGSAPRAVWADRLLLVP